MATSLHSGKAKFNYLTLRVDEMRDGESWCKYALRPALFVSGHQGSRGSRPARACAWHKLSLRFGCLPHHSERVLTRLTRGCDHLLLYLTAWLMEGSVPANAAQSSETQIRR